MPEEYNAKMHWFMFIQLPSLLILPLIKYYVDYKTTKLSVDKNGVHFKRGLINIKTEDYSFRGVESVNIYQSFWGVMFNFGDVIIRGTGNNYEEFKKLANPNDFKENFYKFKNADNSEQGV